MKEWLFEVIGDYVSCILMPVFALILTLVLVIIPIAFVVGMVSYNAGCKDHVPSPMCDHRAKLTVVDRVAVCKCEEYK